jgi:preprotein translocase subunit SecD
VLDEDDQTFLEGGCALIVATVAADGAPHASRGWGLDVLGGGDVRLLLDADDEQTIANVADTGSIAITAADVRTLHSVQLKGSVLASRAADPAEVARARRYSDDFFLDIHETDGTTYEVLERMVPSRFVACECHVDDWFDQTPGPGAGAPVDRIAPAEEPT